MYTKINFNKIIEDELNVVGYENVQFLLTEYYKLATKDDIESLEKKIIDEKYKRKFIVCLMENSLLFLNLIVVLHKNNNDPELIDNLNNIVNDYLEGVTQDDDDMRMSRLNGVLYYDNPLILNEDCLAIFTKISDDLIEKLKIIPYEN